MQNEIITAYMHHVLEHGERPKTIYSFASQNDFKEQDFYKHFASFDAIEKSIFGTFLDKTLEVLHNNEAYEDFTAKDKLLSFYYTFFEMLTANRSYVLFALNKGVAHPKTQKQLTSLKSKLNGFVNALDLPMMKMPIKQLSGLQEKSVDHIGWSHFLFVLDFWMKDVSPSFEKTDVLIEKSIHTGIQLVDSEPLKNMIDLGKFLFKEIKQR